MQAERNHHCPLSSTRTPVYSCAHSMRMVPDFQVWSAPLGLLFPLFTCPVLSCPVLAISNAVLHVQLANKTFSCYCRWRESSQSLWKYRSVNFNQSDLSAWASQRLEEPLRACEQVSHVASSRFFHIKHRPGRLIRWAIPSPQIGLVELRSSGPIMRHAAARPRQHAAEASAAYPTADDGSPEPRLV